MSNRLGPKTKRVVRKFVFSERLPMLSSSTSSSLPPLDLTNSPTPTTHTFTWDVDSLSNLHRDAPRRYDYFNPSLGKVEVALFPDDSLHSDDDMMICRVGQGTIRDANLYLKLSVLKPNGETLTSYECQYKTSSGIIPHIHLSQDYDEDVLKNDVLKLKFQITLLEECNLNSKLGHGSGGYDRKSTRHDFISLLENGTLSDVVCLVAGKELKLHKAVLAARSPVFAAMFNSDLEESKTNSFKMEGISLNVFEQLLRYFYTGLLPDMVQFGLEIFEFSDKYQMESLKEMASNSLIENLTVESALSTLVLADRHQATGLKRKSMDFVNYNKLAVTKQEDWKKLKKSNPDLIFELYESL